MAQKRNSRPWEHWDDPGVAEKIDRYWRTFNSELEHRKALAKCFREFADENDQVLEVGCGSGFFYEAIKDYIVPRNYLGIDTSIEMIRLAQERHPHVHFEYADAHKLHFANDEFNTACAFEVFCHLPDPVEPIRELIRVARNTALFSLWISGNDKSVKEVREDGFIYWTYSMEYAKSLVEKAVPKMVDYGVKKVSSVYVFAAKKFS